MFAGDFVARRFGDREQLSRFGDLVRERLSAGDLERLSRLECLECFPNNTFLANFSHLALVLFASSSAFASSSKRILTRSLISVFRLPIFS